MNDYTSLINEHSDDLRKAVAQWFADIFLYRSRYDVDYSNDPPWDHSGRIIKMDDFELDDYDNLEEILEESTGESQPSFISGCGFFYDTYSDELHELIKDHVYPIVLEASSIDYDVWTNELYIEADRNVELLFETCSKWKCKELFNEGEVSAKNAELQRLAEQHAREIEEKARKVAGNMLLQRLGLENHNRICKNTADWQKVKNILNSSNLSENDLKLISLVLNASNSIIFSLSQGKIPK